MLIDGSNVTSLVNVTTSGVSYSHGSSFQEGIHDVYLEVSDNIGNMATASWTFMVDVTPPLIYGLQPANSSITNNNTSSITADYIGLTAANSSNVFMVVDGSDVTSLASMTASNITYTPGSPFYDGLHEVFLEVQDDAGNIATAAWSFTVDATSPVIASMWPPHLSIVNNNKHDIVSTYFDSLMEVDITNVTLKVDDIDVTSDTIITNTRITYKPTSTTDDGLHSVFLEIKDIAGNHANASWSFFVDTTPPTISNLHPADDSFLNNTRPTISADFSDPSGIAIENVYMLVDNIDVTSFTSLTEQNITYFPSAPLSDGLHNVYLWVEDIKFNLKVRIWSFIVDTEPPTISGMQPSNNSTVNSDAPVIGSYYTDPSGIDINSVLLLVNDIDVTSMANITSGGVVYQNDTMALAEGSHEVLLEVSDIAGNTAVATWSFMVNTTVPDTSPPLISNLNPANLSTTDNHAPNIRANYSDPSGIDLGSVSLHINGENVSSASVISEDGISFTPISELSDGIHIVHLEIRDALGNLATTTWSFNIETPVTDFSPPIISNLNPGDESNMSDNTPTISADYGDSSGIDVSSITVKVDGIEVTSSAIVTAGHVRYVPDAPLTEGYHSVHLKVMDVHDNLATMSWWFTVDTKPPTIITAYLEPPSESAIAYNTLTIVAGYADSAGIDLSSVRLVVDGFDVTSNASVNPNSVTYGPDSELEDGIHSV
jgi:hypothetical protein